MNYSEMTKKNFLTQKDFFTVTLKNTPQDKIGWKPDENSMSAQEMVEHLAGANHYFAAMIKGEQPSAPPSDQPELTFDQAVQFFEESCDMMANTLGLIPEEQLADPRETPFGQTINVRFAMTIPSSHLAYHWGQLSALQKQYGDLKDHFLDGSVQLGQHYK